MNSIIVVLAIVLASALAVPIDLDVENDEPVNLDVNNDDPVHLDVENDGPVNSDVANEDVTGDPTNSDVANEDVTGDPTNSDVAHEDVTGDPTNSDLDIDGTTLEIQDAVGGMTSFAQSRVVNGNATTIEHFPWIVSMQYYGSHRCGGSIITTNRILTAAHCTISIAPSLLSIRAGSTDSQVGGELVAVTDFINHHLYNPTTLEHDISVMIIASRLTTGATVAVIPLPMQGAPVTDGTVANVAGWGALCEKCPGITTLQYVGLPVMSNELCSSMYGESVAPGMLCAGFAAGGRDACQGDSGGPFNSGNMLIGVVSWGDGCARPNSPGVFTRVAHYRNWINGLL